ncbi:MAG: Flp pilus assembly complex ATPase component TadA, partial [Fimbriimonadaceae bacterium]|nr:Flp pilus assembly complex ATPase component TadA [Fimbriimonadaceae bacterium]
MAAPRKKWNEFLLEKKLITPEQMAEAEKVSQQTNQGLDKTIIKLNFCGEREVLSAKAQEQGIGFVDLDRVTVESNAFNILPERIAKNHNVMPVKKDGNTLYLAMSDPTNIMALDDVKLATGGLRVIPVVAVPGAIEDSIKKYYGSGDAAVPEAAGASTAAAASASSDAARRAIAEAGAGRSTFDDDEGGDGDAEKMAEQAPIIRLANAVIQQAIADRASDIHVEPQGRAVRVRYRIDGVLMEAMTVPKNLQAPLISRLKIMADMNIAERRVPQDGRIEVRHSNKDYDMRVNSIPTPFGEKIVMRILDKSSVMLGLGKLTFTDENLLKIEELVSQPNGMFLCTGPTGSGKTTT